MVGPWLEVGALALLLLAIVLWVDSLKARERAMEAGRAACERNGLQLLDETVSFARMRFARDSEGRLKLRRTYVFEFSDTGNNRRDGSVVLLGAELEDLQLEPYRIQ